MLNTLQTLALMIGLIYVVVSVPMMTKPKEMQKVIKDFWSSRGLLLLGSMVSIAFGVAILAQHYMLSADWKTVMSVLGWAAVLKGMFIMWSPDTFKKLSDKVYVKNSPQNVSLIGFVVLLFGIALSYLGLFIY